MLAGLGAIHRDAWRDAARLGLQAGVAGAAAYVAARWMGFVDPFLVIMMAVTGIERSVGGTMGQAMVRLQSAFAGSVMGLVCLALMPEGWGTAAALAAGLFAVIGAASLRPAWALGVVPVVGMSLGGTEGPLVETAVTTSVGIVAGGAIGVLASLLVWPDRAEARFERQYRRALRATATRLSDAIEATVEEGRTPRVEEHVSAWNMAVWLAQESLGEAKFVDREGMERRLRALRELHESVTILDRAAETASPPLSVEVMRDRVGRLRRDAVEVLRALAEGHGAGRRMGAVDASLGRLREAMEDEDPRAPEHEVHAAVAFGLGEVRRTLRRLIEAQDGAGGR